MILQTNGLPQPQQLKKAIQQYSKSWKDQIKEIDSRQDNIQSGKEHIRREESKIKNTVQLIAENHEDIEKLQIAVQEKQTEIERIWEKTSQAIRRRNESIQSQKQKLQSAEIKRDLNISNIAKKNIWRRIILPGSAVCVHEPDLLLTRPMH
jgi:chromosome segregation ATPase